MVRTRLPAGFSRLPEIIGRRATERRVPGYFPVSKSAWWEGIRSRKYPPGVKLGPNTTAWPNEQLQELIDEPCAPIESRSWNRQLTDQDLSALEQGGQDMLTTRDERRGPLQAVYLRHPEDLPPETLDGDGDVPASFCAERDLGERNE